MRKTRVQFPAAEHKQPQCCIIIFFPLGTIRPIILPALPAQLPPLLILRPMVVCEGRNVSLVNLLGVECPRNTTIMFETLFKIVVF